MTTTTFLTTPLSPTYILAFTISDFDYISNENSSSESIPLRTYARSNAIQGASYSVEVGEKILKAYDDYFGIKFALPKMDQVAVADFPFRSVKLHSNYNIEEFYLLIFHYLVQWRTGEWWYISNYQSAQKFTREDLTF